MNHLPQDGLPHAVSSTRGSISRSNELLALTLCGFMCCAHVQAAGLEFPPGDTFGFRTSRCPTFQVMVDHRVVSCAGRGMAAKIPFEDCVKVTAILIET